VSAPQLCAATLTPPVARRLEDGTYQALTARIYVDEALAPTLSLFFTDREVRSFSGFKQVEGVEPVDGCAIAYEATYQTTGDESQNVEQQLRAQLSDLQNNVATVPVPAVVRFDFTPPAALAGATLSVAPSPLNPIAEEVLTSQIAGRTSRVVLSFTTSELVLPPVLSTEPASTIAFSLITASGTAFTYEIDWGTVAETLEQNYALVATLTDLAGNTATAPLGVSVSIDTLVPPAPSSSQIVFHRSPWGNAESNTEIYTVYGALGSVDPFAWVLVFRDSAAKRELNRVQAQADGSFGGSADAEGFDLPTADLPTVHVRAIDRAGNASPVTTVAEIEWTAAMLGKQPGSVVSNPHAFFEAPVAARARHPSKLTEVAGDALAARDTDTEDVLGGGAWLSAQTSALFTDVRAYEAMAYDATRGRMWTFGGRTTSIAGFTVCGSPSASFSLRDADPYWRATTQGSPPSGSNNPSLAYDAARDRLLLARGLSVYAQRNGAWEELTFSRCANPTTEFVVFYDPVRRLSYVFNDRLMYSWDGASFTRLCETSACNEDSPSCPVNLPEGLPTNWAITFDDTLGETLVYGAGGGKDQTWAFNGSEWHQLCTTEPCLSSRPGPLADAGLAYDRARGVSVLFGGQPNGALCSQPEIMFNGTAGITMPSNQTWTFDGTIWTQAAPAASPPARSGHSMVYDIARERVVMRGGTDCDCFTSAGFSTGVFRDTWEWNGSTWTQAAVTPTLAGYTLATPPASSQHAMSLDPVSGEAVMTGGNLGTNLYRWHAQRWFAVGVGTTATALIQASPTPSGVTPKPLLRYGGYASGNPTQVVSPDTYAFNGTGYDGACGVGPPCLSNNAGTIAYHAAASDGAQLVMFGGAGNFTPDGTNSLYNALKGETWAFVDGSGWTQKCTSAPCNTQRPNARARHAMAFVSQTDGLMLFGGASNVAGALSDTWLFKTDTWTPLAPGRSPPARAAHVLVNDETRGAVMVAMGTDKPGRVGMDPVTTYGVPATLVQPHE
jgi:hypothetical protein